MYIVGDWRLSAQDSLMNLERKTPTVYRGLRLISVVVGQSGVSVPDNPIAR